MRILVLIAVAALALGCATYNVKNEMQADGSYRIDVRANAVANLADVRAKAHERAASLCPKGYDVKGEVPGDNLKPKVQLVAMCKAN